MLNTTGQQSETPGKRSIVSYFAGSAPLVLSVRITLTPFLHSSIIPLATAPHPHRTSAS